MFNLRDPLLAKLESSPFRLGGRVAVMGIGCFMRYGAWWNILIVSTGKVAPFPLSAASKRLCLSFRESLHSHLLLLFSHPDLLFSHPNMLDRVIGRQIILIGWDVPCKWSSFGANHGSSHDVLVAFAGIVIATHISKLGRTARSRRQSMIFGASHACSRRLKDLYLPYKLS